MKQCARCKQRKDEAAFNWRWEERGVLQSVCRDCQHQQSHAHYETHKEKVQTRAKEQKKKAREEAEQFEYNFLSYSTCVDCGEYDFFVLTFDHVRGTKRMDISRMVAEGYSIEAIREEIYKCEVVCANCHMRRESERRSGVRFRQWWPKMPWEK
jgi:hypothetical protein